MLLQYCSGPQNHAPYWFKTPIDGPALGPHMRRPGCNGAVCYCNLQVRTQLS